MSSAGRYLPHYTVEDYALWEGDWELWEGIAVAMTPNPFGAHSKVMISAATAIKNAIDSVKCNATTLAEIDWIVSADTVLRPDVVVLCGDAPPKHVETTPAIVLEVLSDSTRDRDLGAKRDIYQREEVPYYLMLDPLDSSVVFYRLSDGVNVQQDVGESITFEICDGCRLDVEVARLFS